MTPTTPATFHLPHSSQEPLELSLKHPALAMAVVHRDAISVLTGRWPGAIGVYILLGPCDDGEHEYRAYVGKSETGGLKERLTTHRNSATWEKSHKLAKDWWKRALIVRSRDEDGFNSAEAGWLEGRLWDILAGAPAAEVVGKKGDDQTLPKHERDALEQYVPAITAVLRAIGASPDTPDQEVKPPRRAKKNNATVLDLIQARLLRPGVKLRSISSLHEAIAVVGERGALIVDDVPYDTPSGAAVAVVDHEMNGWTFWGFQSGDGTLVPLAELRKQLEPAKADKTTLELKALPPSEKEETSVVTVKPGPLKALLDAGLLEAGATVCATFSRRRHEARVDDLGFLYLADGSVHKNPSSAARKLTGYETNGWTFWRVAGEGKPTSLKTLRQRLESAD